MAIRQPHVFHVPTPNDDQTAALQTASEYLTQAGTQVASILLGCPPLDGDTAVLAELSNSMLRGAALCEGLLELKDERQRL